MRLKHVLRIGSAIGLLLFLISVRSTGAHHNLQLGISPTAFSYLPLIRKDPTPTPSSFPPPTIFVDRPDACYSPDGSVPFGCRIYSPDGIVYVVYQNISTNPEGLYYNEFGVFSISNDERLNTFYIYTSNDLKGMAFSPDSNQVALMYHYSSGHTPNSKVELVSNLLSNPAFDSLLVGHKYFHYMVYWTETCLAFSLTRAYTDALMCF